MRRNGDNPAYHTEACVNIAMAFLSLEQEYVASESLQMAKYVAGLSGQVFSALLIKQYFRITYFYSVGRLTHN